MFKKVWQGSVQLLQLTGAGTPLGEQLLPDLDLQQLLLHGPPFPAHMLWDIAAAVAAQEQVVSEEEESPSAVSVLEVGAVLLPWSCWRSTCDSGMQL